MPVWLSRKVEGRINPAEAALHLALGLFADDKVTLGQAAAVAGISQPAFLHELGKRKIPVHYGSEGLEQDIATVNRGKASAVATVRYPRLVPKDEECAKELKKRTLTNLYNQRPAWLDLVHQKLDSAVFAAYGWTATLSDDELLAKLLALNLARV